MPASPSAEHQARRQRSQHLEQLERFLRYHGAYGTAFVDSDDELSDTWNGLLAWDIRGGAQSGTTIRCTQDESDGTWHYLDDAGHALAPVPDYAEVHRELSRRRLSSEPEPYGVHAQQ